MWKPALFQNFGCTFKKNMFSRAHKRTVFRTEQWFTDLNKVHMSGLNINCQSIGVRAIAWIVLIEIRWTDDFILYSIIGGK